MEYPAKIRLATQQDAQRLLAIYAPYIETCVSFEYEAPSEEEFRRRIGEILSGYPYLICELDGCAIGYAYAHRHMERAAYQWNAELSVYLKSDFCGKGVGKILYRCLLELLTLQNVQNVYGCVTFPNPGSEALHRSLGFDQVGRYHKAGFKFGRWHDVLWYEKEIGCHKLPPEEFLPFPGLDQEQVQRVLDRCTGMLRPK